MAITKDTFTVIAFVAWKHTGPQVTISFEVNVSSIRMGIDQDDMPSKALEASHRGLGDRGGSRTCSANSGLVAQGGSSTEQHARRLGSQPEGHACTLVASNAGPEPVYSASL